MGNHTPALHISQSPSAKVIKMGEGAWHLKLPANARRGYRLAQLDDHGSRLRRDFPWQPPLTLNLQAHLSAQDLPGTWGFGFWNDPFSFMIAYNKLVPRFPTLPQAAWFFYASPHNYLSIRDDRPANGFLAATFSSTRVPSILLALTSPIMALTLLPGTAQLIRRLLRRVIHQDSTTIQSDLTEWHAYRMEWGAEQVSFKLDGAEIFKTSIVPYAPMSMVIWIDNQYAALPPRGGLSYGTLPNPVPAWLEIRELEVLDHI